MRINVLVCVIGACALFSMEAHACELRLLDAGLTLGSAAASPVARSSPRLLDDGGGDGQSRSPGLAAVLSVFIPGLGQIYNGQFLRGLGFFLGVPVLSGIGQGLLASSGDSSGLAVGGLVFAVGALVLYCYGIYDAYEGPGPGSGGDAPAFVAAASAVSNQARVASGGLGLPLVAMSF
jgi:TM2 domain-containing membrane protein YozV